ncbi:FAS1 domain-containing protein [Aspergillus filifer]
MRQFTVSIAALLFCLFCTLSTAWGFPSLSLRKRIPQPLLNNNAHTREKRGLQDFEGIKEWLSTQQPLRGEAMASSNNDPIISDVLPKTRGINIFASLTRQFESVESRLNDASQNVTVLAPRNNAIQDLPRKPWENPSDFEQFGEMKAYEGDEGQDRAKRNLERFVFAHVVTQSPWKEGEEAETLGGDKLKWRKDGDKIFIEPSGVQVDSIVEQVANGEVWVLNGVINYSS